MNAGQEDREEFMYMCKEEQNMSNPEIRAIKVLLDELEQEFNPEELSSPNATVKLLDVQITLYDLRKLMIMQERK
jgi:hypothetical protein